MKIACIDYGRYLTDSTSWTDEVASHGVSHMELAMSKLLENPAALDSVITYALSRGIGLNLHAPYGINNISSADYDRRMSSVQNVKRTIDIASEYHLGTVTFHPGRLTDDAESPEENWERMMGVVSEIVAYAKEKQVYVAIENMERRPYELVYTIEDLNRFAPLAEGNPYFGVTIDFAHFASHNIGYPNLQDLKLPLYDVHMSQIVNNIMHSALTVGNGEPDVREVCRILKEYGYDGVVALEVREPIWESVELFASALQELERK